MMNEQIVPFGAWLSNTVLSANTDDESYCSNREEEEEEGGMLREEERRHDKSWWDSLWRRGERGEK